MNNDLELYKSAMTNRLLSGKPMIAYEEWVASRQKRKKHNTSVNPRFESDFNKIFG